MTQSKVVKIPLSVKQAKEILSTVAQDSSRVIFTDHAEQRMYERDISRVDVLRVLSTGKIVEGPAQEPKGNWKMTVEGVSAGSAITVVAVIDYTILEESSCVGIVITTF
ncbi:DUF4258 domain-containing protein [Marinobacterium weihaiense]|uniref:DUF4258 domain-containing protein n=1 Tax=Marinobacterium weihaiense TaxID=2851016 RepID=A0ABS6M909_9GAMM|nr:DUF4258 domain-containing protein [Marinobacterium weihaiense]